MAPNENNRRVLMLYQAILDIFGIEHTSWDEFRKQISNDQVSEFYKAIGSIWPPNTDIFDMLPAPSSQLRAFYIGETNVDLILKTLNRTSLYTDQIFIDLPFQMPYTMKPAFSPVVHPEKYKQDTLELIYLMINLAPWIQNDIVNVIPSPMDFDHELREKIWNLAEDRFSKIPTKGLFTEDQLKERAWNSMRKFNFRLPEEQLRQWLANLTSGVFKDISIDEMVKYIQEERKQDPLLVDQDVNLDGELQILRNGSNLEGGIMVSELTGSYLLTSSMSEWKQLAGFAKTDKTDRFENSWQPFSLAFGELDFKFLNNIDPGFALDMRSDGRLENFRTYLREVWKDIEQNETLSPRKSQRLRDELTREYNAAEQEWSQIDKKLTKWLTGSGGLGAIISAGMNWKIPALGFTIDAVGRLITARTDRKNFRKNVPLGVFIDLSRKK